MMGLEDYICLCFLQKKKYVGFQGCITFLKSLRKIPWNNEKRGTIVCIFNALTSEKWKKTGSDRLLRRDFYGLSG